MIESSGLRSGLVSLKSKKAEKDRILEDFKKFQEELKTAQIEFHTLTDAGRLIEALSDKNSVDVLDYVTGVINKTLGELFKSDTRRIRLEKSLYNGRYAHINVILVDAEGQQYDLMLQAGTGLRQVVSFLFCLCLISISGGRKVFIQDEILGGTHGAAKEIIKEIMRLFADEFQFVMIEYGFDDIGTIYNVEKTGKTAEVKKIEGVYDSSKVFVEVTG